MSKAVLISIRPKWCEKICNGEKTIEARKTRPKLETPFKCYIYCTLPKYPHEDFIATDYPNPQFYGGGKVIGEFICDRVYELETQSPGGSYYVVGEDKPTTNRVARESCLGLADMHRYLQSKTGYGWHISELKIYDAPKDLDEFTFLRETKFGSEPVTIKRPSQSWCYVEVMR
jgi:predicted transcriptional regulator